MRPKGRGTRSPRAIVALALGACVLAGCADDRQVVASPGSAGEVTTSSPPPAPSPTTSPTTSPATAAEPVEPVVRPSDGRARDARLSIPELGIDDLEVRSYVGRTDDARGHAIQNTGIVASPTGPEGGTGPGGVGNYQVTGHRTSSSRIFEFLPKLERGDRVLVTAGRTTYVYRVRRTRITSFREPASLRAQRAEVPGRPGVRATRAMITLSTCRTPEDHAEGNYWSDEFDNPEHRIDKIGVLVRSRPA
ncbi:MAG: class E sortase [Nocardioides sp.]|uniref:class E sortase n=1 Tax=Nocardioides sp. TaxID=35761 RepID=UPI0023883C94|nr:class E sortase [Nocardioides sp.]MDE0778481.1 class E sortase [Nocardioides sp.]